ncbi:Os07g0191401, partial [Oryza sativa Japonica Group]
MVARAEHRDERDGIRSHLLHLSHPIEQLHRLTDTTVVGQREDHHVPRREVPRGHSVEHLLRELQRPALPVQIHQRVVDQHVAGHRLAVAVTPELPEQQRVRVDAERERAGAGARAEDALHGVRVGRELRVPLHLPEEVERGEVVAVPDEGVDGGVPRHERPVGDAAEEVERGAREAAGGVEVEERVGDDGVGRGESELGGERVQLASLGERREEGRRGEHGRQRDVRRRRGRGGLERAEEQERPVREVRAAGPCERAEEADGGGGGVRGGVRAVGPRGGEGGGGEREHGGGCGGGNGDAGMATPRGARARGYGWRMARFVWTGARGR